MHRLKALAQSLSKSQSLRFSVAISKAPVYATIGKSYAAQSLISKNAAILQRSNKLIDRTDMFPSKISSSMFTESKADVFHQPKIRIYTVLAYKLLSCTISNSS